MKKLFLRIRYGYLMSRRTLIYKFNTNFEKYTVEERDVIANFLVTRFKHETDEEFSKLCEEVMG